ncbi:MAG: protein-signal peptide and transmembrane prediction, partial [Chloroflexota bacterium]
MADARPLRLWLTRYVLDRDEGGHALWRAETTEHVCPAHQAAIIICDMWDNHWSRGAAERVAAMAPRMDAVLRAARDRGVHIIHAPSDT